MMERAGREKLRVHALNCFNRNKKLSHSLTAFHCIEYGKGDEKLETEILDCLTNALRSAWAINLPIPGLLFMATYYIISHYFCIAHFFPLSRLVFCLMNFFFYFISSCSSLFTSITWRKSVVFVLFLVSQPWAKRRRGAREGTQCSPVCVIFLLIWVAAFRF